MADPHETQAETKADRMSLTERAYIAIKQRIDSLSFLPGQFITEAAICAVLEIGRTPVHQALQRLAVEQLVEIMPRKGIVVLPNPIGRIAEILDARKVLEPELARRAAERATSDDIARLKRAVRGGDRVHGGSDIDNFLVNDRAFHQAIASIAGNVILSDFSTSLHERTERAWYLNYWRSLDVKASYAQHTQVLQHIQAHDAEAAARAMREHLQALDTRFRAVQAQETNEA